MATTKRMKPTPKLPVLTATDLSRLADIARKAGDASEAGTKYNSLHVLADKCDDLAREAQPCEVDDAITWLAQGGINIAEGLTEIEAGSPVHKAMLAIVRFYQEGKLWVRK